jgi:hypothetical protein
MLTRDIGKGSSWVERRPVDLQQDNEKCADAPRKDEGSRDGRYSQSQGISDTGYPTSRLKEAIAVDYPNNRSAECMIGHLWAAVR